MNIRACIYWHIVVNRNVEKSNHVIFHPPQQKVPSINVTVNQKKLEHKEYIKHLGVLIDSKLSWKLHIREISKKVSHSVGILAKMRHYANINVLTKLYYAIIYPFLIYGLLAWGSTYPTTLKSIVILQKKAVRIITSSKHDARVQMCYFINYPFLNYPTSSLCIQHYLCLIFTIIPSHLRFQISLLQYEKFIITTQDFPRVQLSILAYTPAIRTNCGKFSLRYQGPLTWNSIDHNKKEINHRKIFKQNQGTVC